jgi:hypothetical protein
MEKDERRDEHRIRQRALAEMLNVRHWFFYLILE